MALPLGHRIDGEFVCMDCIGSGDARPGGIDGHSALDRRVGSGNECVRCSSVMPHLASVDLMPDGRASARAEDILTGRNKVLDLTEHTETLVEGHALIYIQLHGRGPQVGLRVHTNGTVEMWVHDDPYSDDSEPSGKYTHTRAALPERQPDTPDQQARSDDPCNDLSGAAAQEER